MQNTLQILDRNSKATIFSYHKKIENTTAKHDGQWAFFKTKFVDQFLLKFITLLLLRKHSVPTSKMFKDMDFAS